MWWHMCMYAHACWFTSTVNNGSVSIYIHELPKVLKYSCG